MGGGGFFLSTSSTLCSHEGERERERERMAVGVGPFLSGLFSLLNNIVEKHNEPLLTELIDDLAH